MDRREVGGIGAAEESVVYPAGAGECEVIAACSDCIVHSLHAAISAGERGGRRWGVCQLVGFPTCWEVGKLGSWRGGGEHSRDAGRRRKIAAPQKKGVGTPASIFPMKGRRRKEVCPPIVTEQGAEKSEE